MTVGVRSYGSYYLSKALDAKMHYKTTAYTATIHNYTCISLTRVSNSSSISFPVFFIQITGLTY